MPPKLFSFTHFTKNASANPLVSHTFKTKDLKPFRFIHFQKKGGGYPDFRVSTVDAATPNGVSAAIPEGAVPNPLWQN